MTDKIQTYHLERRALIYLRQSMKRQVYEHPESTDRQYALKQRAIDLGWPAEQVEVIDEDLGRSGTSTEGRPGFKRLAEEVSHGRVGAIFALEVSRLARSSADWHRLLELCSLADVLLVDETSVYCPREHNDRFLLGLKGAMSEEEIIWMVLRLNGAKVNKAGRGELHFPAPVGYLWDKETHRFRLDPDEHVQSAVRLVFERFRLEGSAYAVMNYFWEHGLTLPVHDSKTGEPRWVAPRHSLILKMLHNPLYTGTYVFGRTEQRKALVNGQVYRHHVTHIPQEKWKVVLPGQHPAYLSWDEFMNNQKKLQDNYARRPSEEHRGAAREGHALLQGVALCGRCGHRMGTHYHSKPDSAEYECRSPSRLHGKGQVCWTVSAAAIDQAIAHLVLETVQAPELDLALAIARETERQTVELDRQWKLRLERANYEASLAERRYKAVDPDNRVVARTLEREWNDKLREVDALKHGYEDARQCEKLDLTKDDRAQILALAKDLPSVWNAETTTHAERKNLLRLLVKEVVLTPVDVPVRSTCVKVLWQTGAVTELMVPRRRTVETPQQAIKLMAQLTSKRKDAHAIAEALNHRGLRTSTGSMWTAAAVRRACSRRHLDAPQPLAQAQPSKRRADELYSVREIAAELGVTEHIVKGWIAQGLLHTAPEGGDGGARCYHLDGRTRRRLQSAKTLNLASKRQH